jgi:type I site-specific restriction endonuclease
MEIEENVQGIAQPTIEVMFGLPPKTLSDVPVPEWRQYLSNLNRTPRRTIVFTVSVAQAEMCANVLSRAMPGVEWVCGATPQEKRRATLARFSNGETHAVVNCGVLLEGFDNPAVEVIAMARPTKSRSLYAQAVGRSTRPLPGIVDTIATPEARRAAIAASPKPFCRILDFVGNSGKHKLISCADVLGGRFPEEVAEAAKEKALREGKPVRILITMTNEAREQERKKREAAEKARQEAEARRHHLLAKAEYTSENVNPFDRHSVRPDGKRYASKDGREFSEKQSLILRRAGYDPSKFGYRQGQAIIGKIFSVPSEKQAKALRRSGYSESEIKAMDHKKASAAIDALVKNGWRRPKVKTEAEELAEYTR